MLYLDELWECGVFSLVPDEMLPIFWFSFLFSFLRRYVKSSLKMKGDFAVKHYAGEVVYSIEGWLFKNRDPLNDNVVSLLKESTNPFMKTLWSASQHVVHASARQRGALRTVAGIYTTQLKELMDTLNNTTPNFVRCIKPNHLKKPGKCAVVLFVFVFFFFL